MSWLFNKEEEHVIAVFDIGNGSIGCSFVQLSKHHLPHILYSHREPITFIPRISSERLLETMLKLLKSVSNTVHHEAWKKYHKSVRSAHCIFSSPWYICETRILTIEKDKSFTITQNLIDTIIKKEEDEFIKALHEGKYEKVFGSDIHLLEKKVIHTRLNGYAVDDSIGKRSRLLELTFFSSFMSDSIIKGVEKILHTYFHFKTIEHHTYALASWCAIRDIFPAHKDFLFLDITSEITDVMLTEAGILSETISFPAGRSMILRKIVDELTVPPEVALSFLNLYNKKAVDKEFKEKMDDIIKSVQDLWYKSFIETLTNIRKYRLIPKKIFITADADSAPIFLDILKRNISTELNVPQDMFDVVFLGKNLVEPTVSSIDDQHTDAFIALESTFLNKILV
jgi:hypothetical protein